MEKMNLLETLQHTIMNYQLQFQSIDEFFTMGKHGFYVWLAYGLTALVILWNVLQPVLQRRRLLKQHAQQQRREKNHASST